MRTAIIDDLKHDRDTILAMLRRWCGEHNIVNDTEPDLYPDGDSFIEAFEKNKYDIIFLDIFMSGMTGMDAARTVRETDKDVRIIFTTTSLDHAVDGYDVSASYYLVKPFSYEKFSAAMAKCIDMITEKNRRITVPVKDGERTIELHKIIYTEFFNRRVLIHMSDGTAVETMLTQRQISDILLKYPFFCDCMKGILVNLEMVDRLMKDRFVMNDGSNLPISRLKYSNVKEKYFKHSFDSDNALDQSSI